MLKKITAITMTMLFTASMMAACSTPNSDTTATQVITSPAESQGSVSADNTDVSGSSDAIVSTANVTSNGKIDTADLFTERDLTQNYDASKAHKMSLSDGQNVSITSEGVYLLSGSANNVTVTVEADDKAKVQLVLDGVTITNTSAPAIYVKSADKVFVTTTQTENSLSVNGAFTADGETNTDAVIFSKDDIVLNGLGTLKISSADNGISGKDDIKITGGTITVESASDAIEANDSIAVSGGTININSQKDGLHAENSDDNSKGYIYICGGTLNITAASDAVQATTVFQIDDGTLTLSAREGIEGTYVQINGGTIDVSASDDGINAANKSGSYQTTFEMNGGNVTVTIGAGDTDGVDSNGDLYINGGTISVNGQSPFDYDGTAQHNGGTIIVNGTETDEITNQFGGMGGGMGGPGGMGGFGGMR